MPILLAFWKPIAGVLLIVALVAAFFLAKHSYDNEKREEGAAPVRAEFAAYKEKEAAIVAGLAASWDQKRLEAESNASKLESERAATFATLQDRARSIGSTSDHRFAGGAVKLFDDARSATEATGATTKPAEAAPAPASSTEEYIVSLYEWASVCKARVNEWASFYQSLRSQ